MMCKTQRQLCLAFLLICFLGRFASVAQQPDSIYRLSLSELLNLKIELGSRVEQRTKFEALAPVDVFTSDQLVETGCIDLGMALQRVVSSVQYFTPILMDGADHVYPLSIRGFGADQVLVLINGKRYHQTAMLFENSRINKGAAAVDFRTIPIRAVERIEILKDVAAAQYDSDGIAGIINIILKSDQANLVDANYGMSSELDGQQFGLSANYGNKFTQGNYQFFMNYIDKEKTDRAGLDQREQYFTNDPNYTAPPVKNQEYGQSAFTDFNIGASIDVKIDPQTKVYSLFMFGHRVGEAPGYFRRPLDNRTVREIYPNGFLPFIAPVIKNTNMSVGIETIINNWKCDISATYGNNIMEFNVKNSLNASMGIRSPQSFYCGQLISTQRLSNINLKRKYQLGINTPLLVAFGSEFCLENYEVMRGDESSYIDGGVAVIDGPNAGARTAPGAQVLPGFSPNNEIRRNRHNIATYVDLETTIFKFLTLSGAARGEKFSDFGETINGKISIRTDLTDFFAIRGSVGTGFRAPSLAQSFYSSTVTNFIDGVPYENGTFNTEHPIARQLGATKLKPERSVHHNAGIVLKINKNLQLILDTYFTTVSDRIVFTGNFTATNAPVFAELFTSYGIGGARYFTNAIKTRTQGADITIEYDYKFNEKSSFTVISSTNLNRISIVGKIRIPEQVIDYQNVFFDKGEMMRVTKSIPEFRSTTDFRYKFFNTIYLIKAHYFGPITVVHGSNFVEQKIKNGFIFDASVTHIIMNNLKFTIGALNILNHYPEKQMTFDGDYFTGKIFPYSQFSPYGFSGAQIYFQISLNF